jgi:hypothetical protein
MWILVVGPEGLLERDEGAANTLRELGCRVRTANLWDSLERAEIIDVPPTVVLVEAIDEVDAGRAALTRIRAVKPLSDTRRAISRSGPAMVFWRPVVAQRTSATGISGSAPWPMRASVIGSIRSTPISRTFVPGVRARCA